MSVTVVPSDPDPGPEPGPEPNIHHNLVKTAITHYTPGVHGYPAQPPVPARTVTTTEQQCGFVLVTPGGATGVKTRPSDVTDVSGGSNWSQANTGSGVLVYMCRDVTVTRTIPAIPGYPGVPSVAPSTTVDYQLGWNAGARSIDFIRFDGYGEFKVRASVVGVICGLNIADPVDAKYIGTNIDYAFVCARGVCRVMESGTVIVNAGLYTDETVFRIERAGDSLTYSKDGAVVHVTDLTPLPFREDLFMEAALYSGYDEVFDPVLVQVSAPDLTAKTGQINITLPPPKMRATQGAKAEINIKLPPMSVGMTRGLMAPAYALMGVSLPRPQPKVVWLTGEVGSIDLTLPPVLMLLADHAYGELNVKLPVPAPLVVAYEGMYTASMGSVLGVAAPIVASKQVLVRINSSFKLQDTLTFNGVVTALMMSTVEFAVSFDPRGILNAMMNSSIALGWVYRQDGTGSPGAEDDGSETWAVNLATSGSTKYDNYGFNSFAMFNGRYYGARDDGVSVLEGNTDAGELIRANVDFGVHDFGNQQKVTVDECFVGMSGKGNLFLKLTANGKAYIYKTQNFTDKLQQQRIKPGKGLRTNYVHLELYNEQGADFEIDTVKFTVIDLSRKL